MQANAQANPEGTWIEEFEIRRVLGQGGFGITYLATEHERTADKAPLREVALKEFFPTGFAARIADSRVVPADSKNAEETFYAALKAFKKEAQTLVKFDHESIVRVQSVFESHGTAYYAMPYIRGLSLDGLLKQRGTLKEAEIRQLLLPVLGALEQVHASGTIHRDIKPGNIMLRDGDQRPILIDFGAAKQLVIEATRSDPTIAPTQTLPFVSDGYSAPEQYGSRDPLLVATDLYALAATIHRCIVGKRPPSSVDRALDAAARRPDALQPLAPYVARGEYSRELCAAVEWGLAIKAEERPQSAAAFRDALEGRIVPPVHEPATTRVPKPIDSTATTVVAEASRTPAPPAPPPSPPQSMPPAKPEERKKGVAWIPVAAVALVAIIAIAWLAFPRGTATKAPAQAAAPSTAPSTTPPAAATAPAATAAASGTPNVFDPARPGVPLASLQPAATEKDCVPDDTGYLKCLYGAGTWNGLAFRSVLVRVDPKRAIDEIAFDFAPEKKPADIAAAVSRVLGAQPRESDSVKQRWTQGTVEAEVYDHGNEGALLTLGDGARREAFWSVTNVTKTPKPLDKAKTVIVGAEAVHPYDTPSRKAGFTLFNAEPRSPLQVLATLQGWTKVRNASGQEGWLESRELR